MKSTMAVWVFWKILNFFMFVEFVTGSKNESTHNLRSNVSSYVLDNAAFNILTYNNTNISNNTNNITENSKGKVTDKMTMAMMCPMCGMRMSKNISNVKENKRGDETKKMAMKMMCRKMTKMLGNGRRKGNNGMTMKMMCPMCNKDMPKNITDLIENLEDKVNDTMGMRMMCQMRRMKMSKNMTKITEGMDGKVNDRMTMKMMCPMCRKMSDNMTDTAENLEGRVNDTMDMSMLCPMCRSKMSKNRTKMTTGNDRMTMKTMCPMCRKMSKMTDITQNVEDKENDTIAMVCPMCKGKMSKNLTKLTEGMDDKANGRMTMKMMCPMCRKKMKTMKMMGNISKPTEDKNEQAKGPDKPITITRGYINHGHVVYRTVIPVTVGLATVLIIILCFWLIKQRRKKVRRTAESTAGVYRSVNKDETNVTVSEQYV